MVQLIVLLGSAVPNRTLKGKESRTSSVKRARDNFPKNRPFGLARYLVFRPLAPFGEVGEESE